MQSKKVKFEALVYRHHHELYLYAYWLTGMHGTAEELVSKSFLLAWKAININPNHKVFKCWLFSGLRQEYVNLCGCNSLHHIGYSEFISNVQYDKKAIDNKSFSHHIFYLPEEYREPLLLQSLGGFNCNEIASILGLSVATVMTRLFIARNGAISLMHGSEPSPFSHE